MWGKFLHKWNVPGFTTATGQYSAGYETPRHTALYRRYETDRRHYLHVDLHPDGGHESKGQSTSYDG